MKQTNIITATPAARATDPVTSHEAAEHITESGTRASQQHLVLGAVERWPACTSAELAELMGAPRKCSVGGKRAVTWRPALKLEELAA